MGYKDWKVYYFEDSEDIEGTILSNVIDVRQTNVESAESNALELTVSNVRSKKIDGGEIIPEIDSILKVYAANGFVDTNNNTHLLGTFFVKTHDPSLDERKIDIVCGDRTYDMLNRIYSSDFNVNESEPKTAREIIFNVVQTSSSNDGSTQNSITTNMDTTDSEGNAFQAVNYSASNKTAYDVVAELSQPEFTGDKRTYLFWFDENEVFHWQYPDNDTDSYIIDYSSPDVITMNPTRSEAETISSIVYNAGENLNGVTILGLYHDPTSTSTNIKYKTMLDINQLVRHNLQVRFGLPDVENSTLSGVVTNEDFVTLVETQARSRASKYIRAYSRGLWECKVTHKGRRFDMSVLHEITDPISNLSLPNMRIRRVVHKLNKGGWITNLTLEEDEDEVVL